MIVVTGASGQLGNAIVERLLERLPAEQIGVSVRDPKKVQQLAACGVRIREGDFDNPSSLLHAFEGASQVLVVSANAHGETAIRQNSTAIQIAKDADAKRILYTSHMGASPTSHFPAMPVHAATEAALQDSGVPFTSLRNGFYTSTIPIVLGAAIETGELVAPEDGLVSWTTHADLAQAASNILTEESLNGFTPPLTAAEAIDLVGVASIASELTGRPIRRMVVSDDAYRTQLLTQGFPEVAVDMLIGMFQASRRGEFAETDPTLERLLGRSPQSVRDFLQQSLVPVQ